MKLFTKSIIATLLIVSTAQSATLMTAKGFNLNTTYPDGNADIYIKYDHGETLNKKDWIGIYKKGSSTAWENVKAWSWVYKLSGMAPADENHKFDRINLPPDTYEARLFKNNSYTIDKSLEFTIKKSSSFVDKINIRHNNINKSLDAYVGGINKNFKANPNDWIAIYKVGASNDWGNVMKWSWVKDIGPNRWYTWRLNNLKLPDGTYEVRYLLNNTYTTYKKSESFQVQLVNNGNPVIEDINVDYTDSIVVKFQNTQGNKKDWVAIFKKGTEKIAQNVLAWKYNKYGSRGGNIYLYDDLLPGDYDIVMFANDSYNILANAKLTINKVAPQIVMYTRDGHHEYTKMAIVVRKIANHKPKDWIAVFKKGDSHTKNNILRWGYLKDKQHEYDDLRVTVNKVPKGEYTTVLFENDTYNELSTRDFKIYNEN